MGRPFVAGDWRRLYRLFAQVWTEMDFLYRVMFGIVSGLLLLVMPFLAICTLLFTGVIRPRTSSRGFDVVLTRPTEKR
jgi:hypothetical protein